MGARVSVLGVAMCAVFSLGACTPGSGPTSAPSAAASVTSTSTSPAAPASTSATPTGSPTTATATTIPPTTAPVSAPASTSRIMPRSRPHAVTTVSASPGRGSGEVAVNWGAVSDADGYKILRSTSANGLFKQTGKLNVITGVTSAAAGVVSIWSYQHSYVPAKKMSGRDTSKSFEYVETIGSGKRCFKVVAFNTAGDSAASKVVCASPP